MTTAESLLARSSSVRRPRIRALSVRGAVPFIGWALLLFIVLFWRLGSATFWDPDEAHYAQTTREMVATGDWLAPHYNGHPFFDKPAVFHVLQGASMAALGPTEFAARLVAALGAVALIAITAWLGAALLTREVALVAALLLTTSPAVFALARYAILDTVFTAFVFGGAALVTVAALRDRPALQWGGYLLIGLAVLTKGPLALVLCGIAFVLAWMLSADARRQLRQLHLVAGLGIVIALSAPWFVYMWLRFGQPFVDGYVLDENFRLFAANRFGSRTSAWFYFRVLAAALLPWTGVLVGRLYDVLRAALRREPIDVVEVVLWSWTAAVVGFFTLSTFKLDHYVFPAAPTLCLLCGRAWHDLRRQPLDRRHAGVRVGVHLVGPLLVAIAAGAGYFLIARLELPALALIVPIAVAVAGAVITVRVNLWGSGSPPVPWIALTAIGITYAGILLWVIPALEQRKVVPDLARWVAASAVEPDRIATYRLNRWTNVWRFYVDRPTTDLDSPAEARAFFDRTAPFYCAMLRPAFEEFVAQGVPLRIVAERDGMWATSGRALWRRRIPPAQFVVVTRR